VAYLTQTKAFFGRDFFVNQHVLIPRPDTEVLVEAALAVTDSQSTIVDVGTGSGAIAISLALETRRPTFAIEIDANAKVVAEHNARTLGADVTFLEGSLFEPFIKPTIHDLTPHLVITANLPYLTPWQWNDCDPDVKNYEPKLALVGGADGLALYDELCTQIRTYLHEASRRGNRIVVDLFIEIDPSQRNTAPALLATHFSGATISVLNDMNGRERVIHAAL
jgi:release factor glutamine methyltransferase